MAKTGIAEHQLRQAVKAALIEVLEERRDLIRDIVEEVLAEFELVEDLREFKKESLPKRSRVFSMPEGEA